MKRALDVAASAMGIILLAPVMIVVAVLIRMTSRGGALFVQPRVGRNQRVFSCYKFRTMAQGAPQAGSHDVAASWVTPLGRKLRSTKLDELPQLFNVLRGDMSLVGPRPCLPSQREVIASREALGVFSVRPGITGPAQLAGVDMSMPEELARRDAQYVRSHGLAADLKIILSTVAGGGSGDAIRA